MPDNWRAPEARKAAALIRVCGGGGVWAVWRLSRPEWADKCGARALPCRPP